MPKKKPKSTAHRKVGYCPRCNKKFISQGGLDFHVSRNVCVRQKLEATSKTASTVPTSFDCKLCGKKFTSAPGLSYHVKHNVCQVRQQKKEATAQVLRAKKAARAARKAQKQSERKKKVDARAAGAPPKPQKRRRRPTVSTRNPRKRTKGPRHNHLTQVPSSAPGAVTDSWSLKSTPPSTRSRLLRTVLPVNAQDESERHLLSNRRGQSLVLQHGQEECDTNGTQLRIGATVANDKSAAFFCGGTVDLIAWCPTIGDTHQSILAISVRSKGAADVHDLGVRHTGSGVIQLWSIETMQDPQSPDSSSMSAASPQVCRWIGSIPHTGDVVYALEWKPKLRSTRPLDAVETSCGELGFVTSSGSGYVASINICERGDDKTKSLQLSAFVAVELRLGHDTLTCAAWYPDDDQLSDDERCLSSLLITGTAAGSVALWRICDAHLRRSSTTVTLAPLAIFNHSRVAFSNASRAMVRAVAWEGGGSTRFAAVGQFQTINLWDAQDEWTPVVSTCIGTQLAFTSVVWDPAPRDVENSLSEDISLITLTEAGDIEVFELRVSPAAPDPCKQVVARLKLDSGRLSTCPCSLAETKLNIISVVDNDGHVRTFPSRAAPNNTSWPKLVRKCFRRSGDDTSNGTLCFVDPASSQLSRDPQNESQPVALAAVALSAINPGWLATATRDGIVECIDITSALEYHLTLLVQTSK